MGFDVCIDGYNETKKECNDWADEGYQTCGTWGQDCVAWAKNCVVSWIPFIGPKICKVFEWVCTAAQAVCKFFVWIAKWVCHGWNVFTTFICLVWQTINYLTIFGAVFIKAIFSIPIIGGILKQIVNGATGIFFGAFGFVVEGAFCGLLGICPPKKLRLCVIIGNDGRGPIANEAQVQPIVDVMKQIFKDQANVTVYEHIEGGGNTPNVEPSCDAKGWLEDFWLNGTSFEHSANMHCREYRLSSVIGLSSPIYAFVVRDVLGKGKNGCSLGPLSNYVVFEAAALCTGTTHLAHEAAHACSLWHQDDSSNLMFASCVAGGRNQLKGWQKAIIRGSKYATYF